MVTAGGEGPAGDAGFGLGDLPPGGLFASMVASAFGAKVALVGWSLGPGGGVVAVAVHGLGVAAGGVAGGGAGADEVPEPAAGSVAVFGLGVVTGAAGDGVEGDLEGADEVAELGGLGGVGDSAARWRWRSWRWRCLR